MMKIFDTVYINCDDSLLEKITRKKVTGEVLVGIEFPKMLPTRNSIKISSAKTIFAKYPDWYFHINCEDPVFEPLVVTSKKFKTELENHIRKIKVHNMKEILKYMSMPWMGFSGIGEKRAEMLKHHKFEDWPKVIPDINKSITKSLKKSKPQFTTIVLDNSPFW